MKLGRRIGAIALGAWVATLGMLRATDAAACGGCFHPPNETASVITDHRMILSIAKDQTTLYDQIRYQGDPSSFAWVLPVRGTVTVGLSADIVFGVLDSATRTTVLAPSPPACPPLNCCSDSFGPDAASADGGLLSDAGGVVVTHEQVVGPYQTVQLSSTNPQALADWLAQNGFAIPPDVQPIITQYVNEKFDFLAMKLLPGKGVNAMRPVRVTTAGASAALPLRMVAAGTGAVVGITLWVLGEGRYEPTNFPTFEVLGSELTWDFKTQRSDYAEIRAAKTAASAGKGWERESSIATSIAGTKNAILSRVVIVPNGPGGDYTSDGSTTAEQQRDSDMETLFHGISPASFRITRLRADLAHAALADDVALGAATDQSELPNTRLPGNLKNPPACPTTCTPPSHPCSADGGGGSGDGGDLTVGGGGCTVASSSGEGPPVGTCAVGLLALTALVRGRKKSRGA